MTNAINLENVTKIYKGGKKPAVSDFSLSINEGEFFCLVGPSGCGKSTILKLIADLEKPTSGKIVKNGRVAMAFQSAGLFPWLTVKENIEFGMKMENVSKNEIKIRTSKYMALVELSEFAHKYPRELSGGQRQRVGLARALAVEPEILLLDEPFSALDPLTTEELHKCVLKIWEETHKTILMVSHLLEEAYLLSDRIGVMRSGKLIKVFEVNDKRPREETHKSFSKLMRQIKKEFSPTS
ncbi:MAG TPA: ABC transporter ATP-binding protein [Patescibacteria group bacterium]|nr:ABC transporter ATP-binding protein [Patescibacteria group bacterium]